MSETKVEPKDKICPFDGEPCHPQTCATTVIMQQPGGLPVLVCSFVANCLLLSTFITESREKQQKPGITLPNGLRFLKG